MTAWPDPAHALLKQYVEQLNYRGPRSRRPCASVLRRFQRFVMVSAASPALSRAVLEAWLRSEVKVSPLRMVIRRAQIVDSFLDWLVAAGHLAVNPLAELQQACRPCGIRTIVPALLSDRPDEALTALQPLPRFGSHLGQALCDHVARMRTLGYRYHEDRFLRFDRFVQQRPRAEGESLSALVRAYVAETCSPAVQFERLEIGRILARALRRSDSTVVEPESDHFVTRAMLRQRRRPHIFSPAEIERLLHAARTFPSPNAPLRPQTLYTMLIIGYCAGLRVGEIVRLRLGDIRHDDGTLDIRETKFFKCRRLPLRPSVLSALRDYLVARQHAGHPSDAETPLFCHEKGGYAYAPAEYLLTQVIRAAGLKPEGGRRGPRVHDLRHTFVVHRMLGWYREGINPQARLPYLATYLGHRDIHSTLVYLTITQELLGLASERFRALGAASLQLRRSDPCPLP